jgi:flagellin
MFGGDLTRVRSNVQSLNLLDNLREVNSSLATHQLQFATGKRINEAADDPSGLVLAAKLNTSSRVYSALLRNSMQAKDMLGSAESGMLSIHEILSVVKEMIVTSSSDTLSTTERHAISQQLIQMVAEIDDVAATTVFNDMALLDGEKSFSFKVSQQGEMTWTTDAYDTESLGLDLLNQLTEASEINSANYSDYLTAVEGAIEKSGAGLSNIGAFSNRLEIKSAMLEVAQANTESAYSRVMNADMAETQMKVMQDMILQKTTMYALTMSNVNQASVLSLFNMDMFSRS